MEQISAIILAGGKGTRLKSKLAVLPKPMAPIGEKPFLTYILDYLSNFGINEAILAVGYKYQYIIDHFGARYKNIRLKYAIEDEPLGTGGAILNAMQESTSQHFLVLNGDSIFALNLRQFSKKYFHFKHPIQLALLKLNDTGRYGTVEVNEDGMLRAFKEKSGDKDSLINSGIYMISRAFLEKAAPEKKFSFEKQILESPDYCNKFSTQIEDAYFIDIGIPEDYEKAQLELPLYFPKSLPQFNNWTLFLDRDGVINERIPGSYVTKWEDFIFKEKAIEAIVQFQYVFQKIVVVTNQQGIGKGLFTENEVKLVHDNLKEKIRESGGRIDGIYFAPELAAENGENRKPKPGMAWQAKAEFPEIDFSKSVMIGDSISDIEFGANLGMFTVLVDGKGIDQNNLTDLAIDLRIKNLFNFCSFINNR